LDENQITGPQLDELLLHLVEVINLKEALLDSKTAEPVKEFSVVVDLSWTTPPSSLKYGKDILRSISAAEPFFSKRYLGSFVLLSCKG